MDELANSRAIFESVPCHSRIRFCSNINLYMSCYQFFCYRMLILKCSKVIDSLQCHCTTIVAARDFKFFLFFFFIGSVYNIKAKQIDGVEKSHEIE